MFVRRFGLCLTLANTLLIVQPRLNAATTQMNSAKFAGYLGSGASGPITKVTGSWKVPAVTCNESGPRTVFFAGIDGIVAGNTGTIEQIGTGATCNGVNSPKYYAWYEFLPNESTVQPIDSIVVRPNDTITATVTFSGGQFTATIIDGAQTFTTPPTNVSNAHQSNAECIVERQPGQSGYPLADYGVATFSGCSATVNGTSIGIGQFPTVIRLTMDDVIQKAVLAFTSALSGATSFLVYGCAPPPPGTTGWWSGDGMVGWWPGDGNTNDIIGGNNGALVGGASFASGEVSQAFSFDGATGYVEIPSSDGLQPPNAWTVDAWVYPTTFTTTGIATVIASKYDSTGPGVSWWVETLNSGQLYAGACEDQFGHSCLYVTSSTALVLNQWQHVAVTFDSGAQAMVIYLNGAQLPSTLTGSATSVYNSTTPVRIGVESGGLGLVGYWAGLIDEVQVFNRALQPSEILSIYKARRAGACKQ